MIVLTEETVDKWDLPVSVWRRWAGEFIQEKNGMAGPGFFAILPFLLLGVMASIGGIFEQSWRLGLGGLATLLGTFGLIYLIGKFSEPFFEARHNSIEKYLKSQPIDSVIEQATSIGPGYLGREFLFDHLDNRDPSWSKKHLDRVVVLARSEELPQNQRSSVRHYLSENHPGWSGVGVRVGNMTA